MERSGVMQHSMNNNYKSSLSDVPNVEYFHMYSIEPSWTVVGFFSILRSCGECTFLREIWLFIGLLVGIKECSVSVEWKYDVNGLSPPSSQKIELYRNLEYLSKHIQNLFVEKWEASGDVPSPTAVWDGRDENSGRIFSRQEFLLSCAASSSIFQYKIGDNSLSLCRMRDLF